MFIGHLKFSLGKCLLKSFAHFCLFCCISLIDSLGFFTHSLHKCSFGYMPYKYLPLKKHKKQKTNIFLHSGLFFPPLLIMSFDKHKLLTSFTFFFFFFSFLAAHSPWSFPARDQIQVAVVT